jgi:hypothetical protein
MSVLLGALRMQQPQLLMVARVDELAEGVAQQLERRQPDEGGDVVAHVDDVALLA